MVREKVASQPLISCEARFRFWIYSTVAYFYLRAKDYIFSLGDKALPTTHPPFLIRSNLKSRFQVGANSGARRDLSGKDIFHSRWQYVLFRPTSGRIVYSAVFWSPFGTQGWLGFFNMGDSWLLDSLMEGTSKAYALNFKITKILIIILIATHVWKK